MPLKGIGVPGGWNRNYTRAMIKVSGSAAMAPRGTRSNGVGGYVIVMVGLGHVRVHASH